MKKIIASTFTAALIASGLGIASAPAASAADNYGPKNIGQVVSAAVKKKGKLNKKQVAALVKQIKAAQKSKLISKKQAAKLIKKVKKDAKKKK
ncbi:MAG TPA: hypothetical protein VGE38_05420 [Nocardioides sp.]|uniref:hypothetical protein n=1 Tax=Nocardioides sp. TaxID=35761 RepID=UPI002ED7A783